MEAADNPEVHLELAGKAPNRGLASTRIPGFEFLRSRMIFCIFCIFCMQDFLHFMLLFCPSQID